MIQNLLAAAALLAQTSAWAGTGSPATGPRYEPFERPLYPQIALTDHEGCVLLETGLRCWSQQKSIHDLERIQKITQVIGLPSAICVLAEGMVHCWNNSRNTVASPLPEVRNATKLRAIRDSDLCATTPTGLRCVGKMAEQLEAAAARFTDETRKVFHHDGIACTVRTDLESRKACRVASGFDWSQLSFVKYDSQFCGEVCYLGSQTIRKAPGPGIAPLIEKKELEALTDRCLASRDGEVGCFMHPTELPSRLHHFSMLRSAKVITNLVSARFENSYCAITEKGVQCSHYFEPTPLHVPTGISNPRQIVSIGLQYCVLDDKGVLCWDPSRKDAGQRVTVSSNNPSSILAGSFARACLLSEEGIQCWTFYDFRNGVGLDSASEYMPPEEIQTLIRIRRLAPEALAETLPKLGEEVYAEKRTYFTAVATALKDFEKEYGIGESIEAARLFTFFALEPVITQLDSPIFVRTHIPNYKRMQERLGKEKGISSLSQVPASMAAVRMATRTLHAVLGSTSRLWPSEATKQAAIDLQRKLGVFLAKAKPNVFVLQRLVQDLQESMVFDGLIELPRTKSLGLTAVAITEWLATAADSSEKPGSER